MKGSDRNQREWLLSQLQRETQFVTRFNKNSSNNDKNRFFDVTLKEILILSHKKKQKQTLKTHQHSESTTTLYIPNVLPLLTPAPKYGYSYVKSSTCLELGAMKSTAFLMHQHFIGSDTMLSVDILICWFFAMYNFLMNLIFNASTSD